VNSIYHVDVAGCCNPDQDLVRQHYLAAFIDEQQHSFAELARRLGEQKLLSETEVKAIRPKLQIRIWDLRGSRQPALPDVTILADNTTIMPF
jgi:hypothetical protein